ncbi:MAG: HAD-IA family hydrolase [Kiritimatiellales bacterium]
MIRAFIFDMDGVLCDSELFIAEAACRMFETDYHTTVNFSDFEPFIGTGEERYLNGVAEKYGLTLSMPRDKEKTYQLYAECVKNRLQPVPGVIDFIRKASDSGLLLAIATSADGFKLKVNLDAIGLEESLFGGLVTGSDIQNKKPAPDIFLTAAERLGIRPQDCVVFEDAVNGVQAAKTAGALCVGVTTSFSGDILQAAGADSVISDFRGLHPAEAFYK